MAPRILAQLYPRAGPLHRPITQLFELVRGLGQFGLPFGVRGLAFGDLELDAHQGSDG